MNGLTHTYTSPINDTIYCVYKHALLTLFKVTVYDPVNLEDTHVIYLFLNLMPKNAY